MIDTDPPTPPPQHGHIHIHYTLTHKRKILVAVYLQYVCEGQTAPPSTAREMIKPHRPAWHTHTHTLTALQVSVQKSWWTSLESNIHITMLDTFVYIVNTCISCDDTDLTKTSCWLTRPHPGPLRSSAWEPPVRIHSSAGQYDGSHDGWWTLGMDSFLMKR